jgi:dTDP-4-dehydrorhamnose 3,5-epimerase
MEKSMLIQSPFLLELPGEKNDSGSLNFWENHLLFPQGIKRCFWITKVDEHTNRGNHAHWQESQLLVAMNGSVSIFVESVSGNKFSYILDSPALGLYVPPLNWVSVKFTAEAVLLGISDQGFAEEDYIRDKHYFESLRERYI